MVKCCSSFGCQSVWYPNSGISFHGFPLQRPDILAKWIHVMRRKNFKATKSSYLCSQHFTLDSYLDAACERKVLKKDAVPSIFNFPAHLQPHKIKPRRELIRLIPQNHEESPTFEEVILKDVPKYCEASVQTVENYQNTVISLRKQVKALKQKMKRKNMKIAKMKCLLKNHKHKNTLSNEL